uniref:Uncharacterized protein n=1 Tax=Anguilla anguilla TaxID=7936 RepID=A0A0E9R625_ANGAN
MAQNGCRASPRWQLHIVVVDVSFSLIAVKHFDFEKSAQ